MIQCFEVLGGAENSSSLQALEISHFGKLNTSVPRILLFAPIQIGFIPWLEDGTTATKWELASSLMSGILPKHCLKDHGGPVSRSAYFMRITYLVQTTMKS
jgi:hypothetical protein